MKIDHVNAERSDTTHIVLATNPPLNQAVFSTLKTLIAHDPRFTLFTFELDMSSGLKISGPQLTSDLAQPLAAMLDQAEKHLAQLKDAKQQAEDSAKAQKLAKLQQVANTFGVPLK